MTTSLRRLFRWLATAALTCGVLLLGVVQMRHYREYGHFFKYGIHTDLRPLQADIGIPGVHMMYSVVVHNFTLWRLKIECFLEGNDVIAPGFPRWIPIYREDLQRWDKVQSKWSTVRAMNMKEPMPFKREFLSLWPGRSVETNESAYGAIDGVKHGDIVRVVIQQELYRDAGVFLSPSFEITDNRVDDGVDYRTRH